MKPPIVKVPSTKSIIQPAAGFKKKDLADNKVDLMALCWYGCRYCSSNHGTYIRTNWESGENFKALAEKQLGRKVSKKEFFSMNLVWPDVIEKLQNQLSEVSNNFGKDKVLVFSELTDGFSPKLVEDRTTRQALDLLIGKTSFRIRVLTKNAVVGEPEWIEYFLEHKDRFTVGLSTGSLDDKWSKKMELGTSPPSERLQALKNLQEAGVSTYGMLCPVFPDMVMENRIVELVEQINPNVVEYVWAEPYNDRDNWELVQKSYSNGSKYYNWFDDAFGPGDNAAWSEYATSLYDQLAEHAQQNGWIDKLKYLLYEANLTDEDAHKLIDAPGILFQSINGKSKISKHPVIAASQLEIDKADADEIKSIDKKVMKAYRETQKAWVRTGQELIRLNDKIDTLGKGVKRKAVWQYYFGVNSFTEYCETKLKLNRETVYQMSYAIKWINEVKPELLESHTSKIPYYTNFRVLKPHHDEIVQNPDKYSELIDISLTGTRSELQKKCDEFFPDEIIDASFQDEFDLKKALSDFRNSVSPHIDDELIGLFDVKMNELEEILLN